MPQSNRIRTPQPLLLFDLDMLKAMADETRSRIMRLLCTPELGQMVPYTVGEIAAQFDLTASTVSHHLQLLKRAGLVRMERRGKERCYSLDFESLHKRVGQFYDLLNSILRATEQARSELEG
ncbi:MAG: winged helix-turn-helix transcriptional regulator [Bradymonadales bacterium]|nr:winged helix-turn-helix transcriptional regulator [Bradymonadales bacterium]